MNAIILVKRSGVAKGSRVGSITQNRKGFFWHGWAEGKGRSARSASATIDEALGKAKKVLGDIEIMASN
jgi:hypothetical protein